MYQLPLSLIYDLLRDPNNMHVRTPHIPQSKSIILDFFYDSIRVYMIIQYYLDDLQCYDSTAPFERISCESFTKFNRLFYRSIKYLSDVI
mgnify:FL=1